MFMDKSSFMGDQKLAARSIAEYEAGKNVNAFCAQCHGEGGALDPNNEWNLKARYRNLPLGRTQVLPMTSPLSSPFFSVHQ